MPDPQSVRRPKRLKQYQILDSIGSGGMSTVYRALDRDLNRVVALKMTALENSNDVTVADFQREVMVARRVQHDNVVTVLDHGCVAGWIFLAMPIVTGATLSNATRLRDPLRQPSSRKSSAYRDEWVVDWLESDWQHHYTLASQAVSAVCACHESGVYHRDIKPANLLLSKTGDCFLMDFGLAWLKRGPAGHELKTRVGTSRYLPPEVFRGDRDQRSDIYSLGLTLHELATGRKVWGEIPHQEILERRLELRVPPVRSIRADIPLTYATIIDRACHDDQESRYQSANEFRNALRKLYPTKELAGQAGGLSEIMRNTSNSDCHELSDVWLT